jgi:hypothetical protein
MGCFGSEKLLLLRLSVLDPETPFPLGDSYTSLGPKGRLGGGYDGISKKDVGLSLDLGECLGQMEKLRLPRPHPGGKVSHFSVVAVICEPHLGPLCIE